MARAVMEGLEGRTLLSVTLNNGLAPGSADFFSVVADAAGNTRNTTFGGTDTIYDYFGYFDAGSAAGGTRNLGTFASQPVRGSDGIVRSSGTLNLGNGRSVAFSVESSIPSGGLQGVHQPLHVHRDELRPAAGEVLPVHGRRHRKRR